jgi:hypothetical protein
MFRVVQEKRPRQEVLKNLKSLHGAILLDAVSLMKLVVTQRQSFTADRRNLTDPQQTNT